jgi:ferredoxin
VLALDEDTLPTILLETFASGRQARRDSFREEVVGLLDRIDGLLRLEDSHSPDGQTADALASTLATGDDFVDPAELSKNLPVHHGSKRMASARRARIEDAASTLRDWLDSSPGRPELVLVRAPSPLEMNVPDGCRIVLHADGPGAAIGLFDGLAEGLVDIVRAVRVARLEVDDHYDPELHDKMIERTGWRSFTAEEMLLMPAVVVLETGRRLRGSSLASLSVLLRSGRPVHVLVSESTSELQWGETRNALAGYHPGLGYLAVAHREAFVLQSTLARPRHLIGGLQQMATMLHPAVALVAVPSWQSPVSPWLQLVAAQQSRTTPCFHYDPLAGETWAERFDLEDNPQVDLAWPTHEVAFLDESGEEATREEAFTFAHAAAVDPAYGSHFRVIPHEAWGEDQTEIADYLAAPAGEQRRKVPFLWVVTEAGELARAVITRELAFACRDRSRAWRILQELAGLHNEYARRAAENATEQTRAEADEQRRELEAAHAEQVERVRSEAAGEAMDRLVAVLMDLDGAPAAALARPQPAVPPAVGAEAAPPAEAAPESTQVIEEEEEDEVSFNDPYINSILCTTCNECTNLNPRMFAYNENRQAVIADASAGTFEQMIKAAEKCPARCIHPGAPRSDDATVTDELIARAKPFN